MEKLTITVHDGASGTVEVREMTEQELIEYKKAQQQAQGIMSATMAKNLARESALNKLIDLGLTEEEVKAFLG